MKLITYDSYKNIAESEFDDKSSVLPRADSVVFVSMEHIPRFFSFLSKTSNRYTVISAGSDYSLVYQKENPVWKDMGKWLNYISIDESTGYSSLHIPARCVQENCKESDTYSIKVYSHTLATFDHIPDNIIKWYATNCNLSNPRIAHIPFGIPHWNEKYISEAISSGRTKNADRKIIIYNNHQLNTLERVTLYKNYSHLFHTVNESVSHQQYVEDLLNSEFVISLPGNGFDCFRTMEAIYCGCVPIIVNQPYNRAYDNLPHIKINNFQELEHFSKTGISDLIGRFPVDNSDADWFNWRDKIRSHQ